jgi:hypothetical protein
LAGGHLALPFLARTPGWRARRWVVEACHSWLNRNRAILVRWSKKDENHLALLQLACGVIAFKKACTARRALAQGYKRGGRHRSARLAEKVSGGGALEVAGLGGDGGSVDDGDDGAIRGG